MSQPLETAQIPVVDISSGLPEAEVAEALVNAAATYGFVYVKNKGTDIPTAAIDRMFELVKPAEDLPSSQNSDMWLTCS